MSAARSSVRLGLALVAGSLLVAGAAAGGEAAGATPAATSSASTAGATAPASDGLEHLVPSLAGDPYHLAAGPRPYLHRLSISPAYGQLGSDALFALRIAYHPNDWLGYEASLGHNPGHAVHGVLHTLSATVRRPLPGRWQPYLSGGYGMLTVLPGQSDNAVAVTKNTLTYGGGLECFIRDDLALRGEMRGVSVFGSQRDRDGLVVYDYLQESIGIAFYRTIAP